LAKQRIIPAFGRPQICGGYVRNNFKFLPRALMRSFLWTATALLLVLPASCLAEDLKVGVIDMQKALTSSKSGGAAQRQYEKEVKEAQSKLDVKKGEFEKLQQAFSKQRDSLNEKARGQREEELINMEKELKRTFQDSKESLQRRNAQLVGDLVKKIRAIVEDVGKSEGYSLILEKNEQTVLYADSAIDITPTVVARFDGSSK
jgi:outer membrane protein